MKNRPPDILIINPPSPASFQANRDFMGGFGATNAKGVTRVPSLAAEYVTGALKDAGFETDIIDLAVETDPESMVGSIGKVRLIGLHCSTATFKDDLIFADRIKEKTGAFVFMFGPQVSVTPEYAMTRSSLDAAICGEPESASVELAESIFSDDARALADIKGLWWRDSGIKKNPPRPFEEDLDSIPFPYRDVKYANSYFYRDGETPFLTVLASRGCPYDCIYCPYPVSQGNRFRARTPGNVIEELLHEKKQRNYKMVLFRDPVFSFNRERTIELCRLIKEKVKVMWRCETACLNVDDELLDIMKASGCIGINFGIETGSPALIGKYAKKSGGLDRIKKVFAHCRNIGIGAIGFFIVGLPGETRATMRETLKFAIEIDPAEVNFTTATPFPGTKLNRMMRENGRITGDEFEDFRIYGCMSGVEDMKPQEVRSELIKMYLAFYLRPGRLLSEISKNPFHFIKKSFSMLLLLMKR
jgi:anaerobic magnesium-protoporphyrin IX monomethyl ester cyclase